MARTKKRRSMISTKLSQLPVYAGTSVLNKLAQLGRWALNRFMDAPLQNSGIGALSVAIALSASNALFWQTSTHPAPLFSLGQAMPEAMISPSQPLVAPSPMPMPNRNQLQNALSTQPVSGSSLNQTQTQGEQNAVATEVGNEQLAEAQKILQSLGLFDGKVDGYYGPKTAEGLRAFELRNGITPKGALTPEIISQILRAPTTQQPSAPTVIVEEPARLVLEPVQPSQAIVPELQTEVQAALDPIAVLTQSVAAQTSLPVASVAAVSINPMVDNALIKKIQLGLASLGFLHGAIDGIAGESTARAIRNFEVYNNFEVTGRISAEMVDLLLNAGASI